MKRAMVSAEYEIIYDADGRPAYAKVPIEDLNDLLDAVEAAATLRRIERGKEEAVPAELVNAILDGTNPIRVWRKYRGMTQADLAAATSLKQPAISRAERGGSTSVRALAKISGALGVDIDLLVVGE